MSILNISISKRLGLAVILPLIGMLYLAQLEVRTMYHEYVAMHDVAVLGTNIAELGEVIHYLQTERGLTAGFLSSKGQNGHDALVKARKESDQHRTELVKVLALVAAEPGRIGTLAGDVLKGLNEVDEKRRGIDALTVTGGQSFDFYTGVLRQMINLVMDLSIAGMTSDISSDIIAFNQLVQAKEIAGQERGLGNGFLGAHKIAAERVQQFVAMTGAQDALLENFLQLQDDAHRASYRARLMVQQGGDIDNVRKRIISAGVYANLSDLDSANWFRAATQRIDAMKRIEEESVLRIAAIAEKNSANALFGLNLVVGLTAVGTIVIILICVLMATSIVRPLRRLVGSMVALANGDLRRAEIGEERGDEIGEMARAVEGFRQAALRNKELEEQAETARGSLAEQQRIAQERADAEAKRRMDEATGALAGALRSLAAGNMNCEINETLAPEFECLRADFNGSVRQLREALISVEKSVEIVNSGAGEISTASDNLSRRTEQQAASIEETAAALEQITVNVKATSVRSDEARQVTRDAHAQAGISSHIVDNAVAAMHRIDQASRQIGQIIGVIDEIAFQTNLLALNAGVEAARAGEAGKGFAVVAQEVRDLAQRSANAAREIKVLINNSEQAVSEGVQLVSDTGVGLNEIAALVERVNVYMDAIATAAQEQAAGLSEVNSAINHMDQSTQHNAAMVEELSAAGAGLATESQTLDQLLAGFKLDATSMRHVA